MSITVRGIAAHVRRIGVPPVRSHTRSPGRVSDGERRTYRRVRLRIEKRHVSRDAIYSSQHAVHVDLSVAQMRDGEESDNK